jgi:acid phosphatase
MTTMCSRYFHNVSLENLKPGTTYYYSIPTSNGTTASKILNFTTAHAADNIKEFSITVLTDMGYTHAQGTYKYLNKAADSGLAFACQKGEICYNGSAFSLPSTPPAHFPAEYNDPVPAGEIPDQGGPQGGEW